MSFRDDVEKDIQSVLEDDVSGFGNSITLIDPNGVSHDFKGYSADIAQTIDPDTGQAVIGRWNSVALMMSSVLSVFPSLPIGVMDENIKPWTLIFNSINGVTTKYKVMSTQPDRTVGVITITCSFYKDL